MKINPKARIRKVVRGYKLLQKVKVGNEIYDATVVKTAPAEWTVTITNKAKDVVSVSTAKTLALGVDTLKGQLVDLGAKFPVKSPRVVAIDPPVPPLVVTTITLVPPSDFSFSVGASQGVTFRVYDQNSNLMPNIAIDVIVTGDATPSATTITTDNDGAATVTLSYPSGAGTTGTIKGVSGSVESPTRNYTVTP